MRRTPRALVPLALSALLLSGVPAQETSLARLEALQRRLAQERASWREFAARARTNAELAELAAAFPRDEFVPGLRELARTSGRADVTARAWLELLDLAQMLTDQALYDEALAPLMGELVGSPYAAELTLALTYGAPDWTRPRAQAALRKVLAATRDPGTRANALAQLALSVGLDETLGEAGRAEARTLLASIAAEFAGEDFIGMSGAEFAAGALHEIERLRVGAPAPDFAAVDQEGARFELSDYRGRVVLLDFWGFV
jgi:hypothetical protein